MACRWACGCGCLPVPQECQDLGVSLLHLVISGLALDSCHLGHPLPLWEQPDLMACDGQGPTRACMAARASLWGPHPWSAGMVRCRPTASVSVMRCG